MIRTGIRMALAIILFAFALGFGVQKQVDRANAERDAALRAVQTAIGERDNADELARQYKEQYDAALREIAALKAENEALTARFEDVTFGYDEVAEATGWNKIRNCTVTAYCPCPHCCGQWSGGPTRSGAMPEQGVTVAVDTSVIPMGAQVMIEGDDTVYTAQDTGVEGAWIDKFYDSHAAAQEWGKQTRTVYWRVA